MLTDVVHEISQRAVGEGPVGGDSASRWVTGPRGHLCRHMGAVHLGTGILWFRLPSCKTTRLKSGLSA